MRQHWIKSIIALVSAALLIILLVLLYNYRDDIFQSMLDPGEPFQTYKKPIAPDYDVVEGWISLPDLSQDPYEHPTSGDAFVIVPDVYKGGEHWNLPVDDLRRRKKLYNIIRPNYVAPYGDNARLFAPHYRQASTYTFMTTREDARRAQDFAYRDVKRAFEYFLKHSPPERPIILAGHGQGASHAQRLLADFFQGPLKERLAAAYIIGHPLPLDKFDASTSTGDLAGLKPCDAAIDTHCVIAFGAFMPADDVTARRFVDRLTVYGNGDYESVSSRPLLCVNPLLWNRSGDLAPRRMHLGGMAAVGVEPDMTPAPLVKQTSAQCQDGILHIDKPKSRSLRRAWKWGGKFRTLPSNVFFEDLKVNAAARIDALLETGGLPTRAQKLDDIDVIEIIDSPVTQTKDIE